MVAVSATPPVCSPRLEWTLALGCGAAVLGVYLATLTSFIGGGDSGEFVTVSHVLGVAHPPGYPLQTLLGTVATWLPLGTPNWRVSLVSAVCGAAAAALLMRAVARWTGDRAAGVLAAGAFAFGPLVWPYAIVAEVFALNNLFTAGLIAVSVRAAHEAERLGAPAPRTLVVGALWLGLGFSNHHTLVFFGIPFVLFLLWLHRRGAPALRAPATIAAGVALGMTPYLYLVVAGAGASPVIWGDTASWDGLVTHFLRREYGTFRLAESSVGAGGTLGPRLALFGRAAAESAFYVSVPLLAAALAVLRRPGAPRRVALLWIGALLFYLVVFCSLANLRLDVPLHVFMQERFWQQGLVVTCALMGVGLAEIAAWLAVPWLAATRWVVAAGLPLALVAVHGPAMRAQDTQLIRDYGEAILTSLPERSVLVISSDEAINSVRYVQFVEGRRRDVRVIPVGFLTYPWFRAFAARHMPEVVLPPEPFTFRQFVDANIGHAPVFVCNRVPWMRTLEERYALWPAGLVEQLVPRGGEPDLVPWAERSLAALTSLDTSPARRFPAWSWEGAVAAAHRAQYERLGVAVARVVAGRRDDLAAHETAARVFEALARDHPAPPPTVFKNLGVAYHALSRTRPDARPAMARAWRRYLELNPADPDAATITRLLEETAASR